MGKDTFDVLILIGRPASGKSEIIDFLSHTSPESRQGRFHIADLQILDDFPMLWTWFEEDRILSERLGQPRLHTGADGTFRYPYLWHLLIERISLEYAKLVRHQNESLRFPSYWNGPLEGMVRDEPELHEHVTTIVEFSRGSEHGGYEAAFAHLSEDLLRRAAVVYVHVSFEESLRKNRRRFNPERPDSILEHALSDEKLAQLYRDDDWAAYSAGDPNFLTVRSICVPYVVFENEDDVTTGKPDELAARLEDILGRLWSLSAG